MIDTIRNGTFDPDGVETVYVSLLGTLCLVCLRWRSRSSFTTDMVTTIFETGVKMSSIRDLPIYLTTSKQLGEHIIKVFCHLFNKYWGSDSIVNLVGYEQPNMDLPDNFNFISMGEQVNGIQMWSTDLRKFFLEQECDNFIHVLDDQFISAPVRFDIMQDLYDVMLERRFRSSQPNNIREDDGRVRDGRSLRN